MRAHILQAVGLDSMPARMLEVGCGTGAVLHSLAQQTPSTIYGLDIRLDHLLQAKENAAESYLTCGDAFHLPFQTGSLNAACCHFLLLWLQDPLAGLREMRRVVKPGGWVIAFAEPDYEGRIDHPQPLQQLAVHQARALRSQGAQLSTGRKLRGLFHQAGLTHIQSGLISGHWQSAINQTDWQQEWNVIEADLADILPVKERQNFRQLDYQAWTNGERILFIPTFYAWGQVA